MLASFRTVARAAIGLLLSAMVAAPAAADAARNQLAIGTYGLAVGYDDSRVEDDELGGITLSYQHTFEQVALRGNLYSLDHDDISGLDVGGAGLLILAGRNLADRGFKIYGGGGLYSETWEAGGEETDIGGLQLTGGLGYNWREVSLDLTLGLRGGRDYADRIEDATGFDVDAAAASSHLIVGIRF
jgi:hypothetical protein